MSKGLTISMIFEAQSLNYGEGIGNISELKKLSRADGNVYTFASRQCLRYDIVRLAAEVFGWNLQVVDNKKGTVQFKDDCTIKESPEMDLFGYMKTKKKKENTKENKEQVGAITREGVVRLSHAISLEPYHSEMEFLSNKGLADRIGVNGNPVNIEQHHSLYTYTMTIDLDKVGKDGDIELSKEERAERVTQLLEIVKILNRNIRGRQEVLAPIFVVGGLYDISNPFFMGRIKVTGSGKGYEVNCKPIVDVMKNTFLGKEIGATTCIGIAEGSFNNKAEFEKEVPDKVMSIEAFFNQLIDGVKAYYEV